MARGITQSLKPMWVGNRSIHPAGRGDLPEAPRPKMSPRSNPPRTMPEHRPPLARRKPCCGHMANRQRRSEEAIGPVRVERLVSVRCLASAEASCLASSVMNASLRPVWRSVCNRCVLREVRLIRGEPLTRPSNLLNSGGKIVNRQYADKRPDLLNLAHREATPEPATADGLEEKSFHPLSTSASRTGRRKWTAWWTNRATSLFPRPSSNANIPLVCALSGWVVVEKWPGCGNDRGQGGRMHHARGYGVRRSRIIASFAPARDRPWR